MNNDPVRPWTREMVQLKARASRAARTAGPLGDGLGAALDDALQMCTNLVQELAGARLENESLQSRLNQANAQWTNLFDAMPFPAVCTDGGGVILRANAAAAALLNSSARHLVSRLLIHFVENRDTVVDLLGRASTSDTVQREVLCVRPKERARHDAEAIVMRRSADDGGVLLWFFAARSAS